MVGEVWNVLFLGTGKKVKGCGARWVGMREGEGRGWLRRRWLCG